MKPYTTTLQKSEDLLFTIPEQMQIELGLSHDTEVRIAKLGADSIGIEFLTEDISFELSDEELAGISLEAHSRNQTLNSYINETLEAEVAGILKPFLINRFVD